MPPEPLPGSLPDFVVEEPHRSHWQDRFRYDHTRIPLSFAGSIQAAALLSVHVRNQFITAPSEGRVEDAGSWMKPEFVVYSNPILRAQRPWLQGSFPAQRVMTGEAANRFRLRAFKLECLDGDRRAALFRYPKIARKKYFSERTPFVRENSPLNSTSRSQAQPSIQNLASSLCSPRTC